MAFVWLVSSAAVVAQAPSSANSTFSTIQWKKQGGGNGRPLIFLPALGFPGDCWSKVYANFEKDHPIYIVTFCGAPGTKPCTSDCLERMIREVKELIRSEGLRSPVLVGHLLGAHVALRVAGDSPDDVAGAFCLPIVRPRAPMDQRSANAKTMAVQYESESPEMWQAMLRAEAVRAVHDAVLADEIMEILKQADRKTYAAIMGEITADPIEASFQKIKAPITLMVPVTLPRESPEEELRQMKPSEHARVWVERMRSIFGGIAKCDTMSLRYARLFPIYEHAPQVCMALDRFLKKLDDSNAKWGNTLDYSSGVSGGGDGWKKIAPSRSP